VIAARILVPSPPPSTASTQCQNDTTMKGRDGKDRSAAPTVPGTPVPVSTNASGSAVTAPLQPPTQSQRLKPRKRSRHHTHTRLSMHTVRAYVRAASSSAAASVKKKDPPSSLTHRHTSDSRRLRFAQRQAAGGRDTDAPRNSHSTSDCTWTTTVTACGQVTLTWIAQHGAARRRCRSQCRPAA
jgi:hypothetical protein